MDERQFSELKTAKDLYNKAIVAQKNGQLTEYEGFIKQLGYILNKIN